MSATAASSTTAPVWRRRATPDTLQRRLHHRQRRVEDHPPHQRRRRRDAGGGEPARPLVGAAGAQQGLLQQVGRGGQPLLVSVYITQSKASLDERNAVIADVGRLVRGWVDGA